MKKWIACVSSLLLVALLAGCDTAGNVDQATPAPSLEGAVKEVALGKYRLKVPEDWTEVAPAAGGEGLLQFHFTEDGKAGECTMNVAQLDGADSPGMAASYLHLLSRFLEMEEVTQTALGERQFSLTDFQMNGLTVSVAAFQQGEDLLLIFVQGLEDTDRQQEIVTALAAAFAEGQSK